MECEEAAANIDDGDKITVDIGLGIINNITKNKSYQAIPFPKFMQSIINSQGLINYIKREINNE